MKEGERSRQADTERERERDRAISRCICLMRQMKSVCLGGALAAGKTSRDPCAFSSRSLWFPLCLCCSAYLMQTSQFIHVCMYMFLNQGQAKCCKLCLTPLFLGKVICFQNFQLSTWLVGKWSVELTDRKLIRSNDDNRKRFKRLVAEDLVRFSCF